MDKYQALYEGQPVCCNCVHCHQHYARRKKRYILVYGGHCTFPRTKLRRPDQACGYWSKTEPEPVSEG
ncbi:MAG: hypothetical protein HFF07_08320 [Oscillospiraceae bacterium]|nr:hypothetical protein [Oscillospiraceae bacterium]